MSKLRPKRGNRYLNGGVGNNTPLLKETEHELCQCEECKEAAHLLNITIGKPNPYLIEKEEKPGGENPPAAS